MEQDNIMVMLKPEFAIGRNSNILIFDADSYQIVPSDNGPLYAITKTEENDKVKNFFIAFHAVIAIGYCSMIKLVPDEPRT